MDASLVLSLLLIYIALPACFLLKWASRPKSLLACPVLFLLFLGKPALQRFRLLEALISYPARAICSFSVSSNHFVLSLEIVFLFAILLLVLYHTFKMVRILPAR